MRTIGILTIVVVSFFCCSRNNGPLPVKRLFGVNDTAIYHIDRDGKIRAVEKTEYSIPGEQVFLNRDTIQLGEDFHAYFGIYKDEFEIIVFMPTGDTLTEKDRDERPKESLLGYIYKSNKKGTFDFAGEVRYDTVVRPFRWKFIVTEGE